MSRRRGFTLIEVLAATALFAVLGAMLFQMVQGAMDLWSRGERVRETEERASAVLDLMAEDLRHLWPGTAGDGEQDGRLLCSYRQADLDTDGTTEQTVALLRFTRVLHEQRSLPWLRQAGDVPLADQVADLTGEEDPRLLMPTGGLAESLYTLATLSGEALPSLLRRVRAPLGGAGSLLDPDLGDRRDRLLTDAVRLAARVLHFEVLCWTPHTTAWELADGEQGVPASPLWDSTRGLIPPSDPGFPYGKGPDSFLNGYDDIFPSLVRVRLVLDPWEDDGVGAARLAQGVDPQAGALQLRDSNLAGDNRKPSHVWVEGEWMAVSGQQGRTLSVKRGVRGTLPAAHDAGAVVRVGRLFERVVGVPAAREDFNP